MSQFIESYDPTIEDCYRKQWVVDDQPCLLEVLDTAGQGGSCSPSMPIADEQKSIQHYATNGSGESTQSTASTFEAILTHSDGEGFLIVYSICNRSTFDRIERIIERINRVKEDTPQSPTSPYTPSPHNPQQSRNRIPITIVGNKRDMYNAREVSTDEGRMLASRLGCEFFETSAKQNANVENAFKSVVRGIKGVKTGATGSNGGAGGGRRKKKKGCVIL